MTANQAGVRGSRLVPAGQDGDETGENLSLRCKSSLLLGRYREYLSGEIPHNRVELPKPSGGGSAGAQNR